MEPDENTLDISTLGDNTITIDLNDIYGATTSTITIDDSYTYTGGDYTIDLDWDNITLEPTMWEDCMPDPQKLKKMCEQYPALEKVYENFRTVYSMVEQDWKGNHEDDESIF